ncbi:tetratricopeptide repeat protein [Saccharopolyspora sp. 5N708]|uniref:tetratricopeptide repeat protein n=1 Tax=Saccharopolyspora sp. 5N708 TaxID=3457424 RepID=UPI003FD2ED98
MDPWTLAEPQPEPAVQSRDPLAVALANASLLSLGYLMLRRWWLAIASGLITIVLVVLLTAVVRSVWFEVVVLLWWAALIAHGWYLAGGRLHGPRQVGAGKQRLVALAVTVVVVLAIGLLRFDAARIERDVAEARRSGDCAQALAALDGRWVGHRVADAPLAARGDDTVQACELLAQARAEFGTARGGDTEALKTGFSSLAAVLAELPGHQKMVEVGLHGFVGGLPVEDSCDTAAISDWLAQRPASGDVLDRAVDVVPRIAPAALVGCGDDLMARSDWQQARARYQQLLDQYPGHELAAKAAEGVKQATQAIELANVRGLLQTSSTDVQPAYCSGPAPYSGAAPVGVPGPDRALVFGNDEYAGRLPADWRAQDAADAVLVICAGEAEYGAPVETCPYESTFAIGGYDDVTFHKIAIPVRVYEVRTGALVVDTRVEIGGASCPEFLEYTTYGYVDLGPPSEEYVAASDADVHAAFAPLIAP